MSEESRRIRKISAHAGPVPGTGTVREETVAKLIDVTTCIGCRACEIACQEWNDLPFADTVFQNDLQTMPDTSWNVWTLIKMNEVEREDGTLQWLLRKQNCMHCADPGCLAACPAEGAIVQYENGIVDFDHDKCIGCQYCTIGCPFNVPKFNPTTKKVFKCSLCSDRVEHGLQPACIKSCPTGCLQFGAKEEMLHVAHKRAEQLREHFGYENAGVYDPPGVGGTGVIYVLHDVTRPEQYGGLPKDPRIPIAVGLWEGPLKWLGRLAMVGGFIGMLAHFFLFGPKPDPSDEEGHGTEKSK
jgi:formate dehydrogenase beta subunit